MLQAVVNEDTDGDRAALKREIKRLQEELAASRRAQAQAAVLSAASGSSAAAAGAAAGSGSGFEGVAAAEQQRGTPARLAAAADAMLAAASPSAGEVSRHSGQLSDKMACLQPSCRHHDAGSIPQEELLCTASLPHNASFSIVQTAARRAALMGALRREDAAIKDVKRLEAELEGMRGLLKVGKAPHA